MTLLEEKEFEIIKDGLEFNVSKGRYEANYPWIVDRRICLTTEALRLHYSSPQRRG